MHIAFSQPVLNSRSLVIYKWKGLFFFFFGCGGWVIAHHNLVGLTQNTPVSPNTIFQITLPNNSYRRQLDLRQKKALLMLFIIKADLSNRYLIQISQNNTIHTTSATTFLCVCHSLWMPRTTQKALLCFLN